MHRLVIMTAVLASALIAAPISGCGHASSSRDSGSLVAAPAAPSPDERAVRSLLDSLAGSTPGAPERMERMLTWTDYPRLVHSVAPQMPGAETHATRALQRFDELWRSKGATATYQAMVNASVDETGSSTTDDDFAWLGTTMVTVGDLFFERGYFVGLFPLRSVEVSGDLATVTYAADHNAPRILRLEVERMASGRYRLAGIHQLPIPIDSSQSQGRP